MFENFDEVLFRKVLRHKPHAAVNILFKVFYNDLCRAAETITRDSDDARDVVQETFSWLLEHHHKLESCEPGGIRNYVKSIVRNHAMRTFRRVKTERQVKALLEFLTAVEHHTVETQLIEADTRDLLRELIGRLPQRERQCLEMKLDENLKNTEIAARLNVGLKAVERSVTSAYRRLRGWLQT